MDAFKQALIDQANLRIYRHRRRSAGLGTRSCQGTSIAPTDGFRNTRDNVAGKLPEVFGHAGFEQVEVTGGYSTVCGTMTLLRARAPG